MILTKNFNNNYFLNQTESKLLPNDINQIKLKKKSNKTDYFDYIYSYPPRIKLKWKAADQLQDNAFPDLKGFKNYFFLSQEKAILSEKFSTSQYLDGFLERIDSSNFFIKNTKKLQTALTEIPIFVLINGDGEIVLSRPSKTINVKNVGAYIDSKLYDSCGAFEKRIENNTKLGLFFMNYQDIKNYVKEIARTDITGTQTVGLSIYCTSLDTAYKITREYHPGIDFRFVPDFSEVKKLLKKDFKKSNLIFDYKQNQLRFRRRHVNSYPFLNKFGRIFSLKFSFFQHNEYFKGVPIYIVQLDFEPELEIIRQVNLDNIGYEATSNISPNIYSNLLGILDLKKKIKQTSLQDAKKSKDFYNHVFFEYDQAVKFTKQEKIRKPKLFVYNLEDFLENWEDHILHDFINTKTSTGTTLLEAKANIFTLPSSNENLVKNIKKSRIGNLGQAANVKFKILKRTISLLFNVN